MRLLVNNLKLPIEHKEVDLYRAVCKSLRINQTDIHNLCIRNKSIDARNNDVKYIYTVEADIDKGERLYNNNRIKNVSLPKGIRYQIPDKNYNGRPIIIGAGPAGLFCAYACVEAGVKPIVIERGSKVENRQKDIAKFWEEGILNPNSNVQFGEGGAGTFSDGKLNTLIKDKTGRCAYVMETFVKFGAPANILYDSKPHIGTDILVDVIKNMREYINDHGADIYFNTQVIKLLTTNNNRITGVVVQSDGNTFEINSDRVVLAIGHSARDTFEMLDVTGVLMEPKPFAIGVRIEHPRSYIDYIQYGGDYTNILPAANYKLTAQTSTGRGVYSFCMCPGGYVVNASSEYGRLAVNGMSYSGRDGANSNTALIVTVTPDDYPDTSNLSGVKFQRDLEAKAYELTNGKVPVQTYKDYYGVVCNSVLDNSTYEIPDKYLDGFTPQIKGEYQFSDVSSIFTDSINKTIIEGMSVFGKKIKGYNSQYAYLSGIESRTSSPVKIPRDDDGVSPNMMGLYPCGEGAGYAGGITSAAMDGLYIAERIIS